MAESSNVTVKRVSCLVAVVLLLLCGGLLFPAVQQVREAASRSNCQSHLKGLALAIHNHADAENARMPFGAIPNPALPLEQRLSWYISILPYFGFEDLYRALDLTAAIDVEPNQSVTSKQIRNFVCPASDSYSRDATSGSAVCHYVGIAGVGADAASLPLADANAGAFGYDRQRPFTRQGFPDGNSVTMFLAETGLNPGRWAAGGPSSVRGFDPATAPYLGAVGRPFGGFHISERPWFGANQYLVAVAMADGSVRTLSHATAPEVLEALATAAGKDDVPADW